VTSDVSLLRSFVDGQGAGAGTYVTYATDLDSNFNAIQGAINSLNAEFKAFGGQNSQLIYDLTRTASLQTGFIGALSFVSSFQGGNTILRVGAGEALTSSGRIAVAITTDLTGSGSSGTRYAALSTSGVVTLQTSASTGALDLYSANWNGSSFDTATLARLPGTGTNNLIVDADDFQAARVQESYGQNGFAVLPSYTYDQITKRINDIVRVMGAQLTSSVSGASAPVLRAMALGGSVGTAGLMLSDGSSYDTSTGFFRQAANSLGITVQGVEAARFVGGGSEPQQLQRAGTTLATPPFAFVGDGNTGFGWVSADRHRAVVGGVSAMEWNLNSGVADVNVPGTMSGTGANRWGNLTEQTKSGAYTVVATDRGSVILGNSATAFTLSLTAAATLGANFLFLIRNINDGVVTVDPSGAELVNGASTLALQRGATAILWCTGSAWRAQVFGSLSNLVEVVKTSTYTVVADDAGTALVANSATAMAFNLTAAATVGAGVAFVARNIGAGILTVDPSGAETINGAATLSLYTNQGALIWNNGTAWRALVMRDAEREQLTANRTYWVRTDGNDANDGSANAAGTAFATIAKAIAVVAALDLSVYTVTIRLGNTGTYAGFTVSAPFVGGPGSLVALQGDSAAAGSYVINSTVTVQTGAGLFIQGVKFVPTAGDGLVASFGGRATIYGACEFGATAAGGRQILATGQAYVSIGAALTISGGAGYWLLGADGSVINSNGFVHTFTGTPAYTVATVASQGCSSVVVVNGTPSGAATGTRYTATTNGVINTNGGGANFFPGNAGGTTASGGQYV
jgi:hypothetical protein